MHWQDWPLWVGCAILLIAGILQPFTVSISKLVTIPAAVGGWGLAIVITLTGERLSGGGIGSSLLSSVIAFIITYIPWQIIFDRGFTGGGGCVKLQVGFGAWVGCALPVGKAAIVVSISTLAGVLAATIGVLALYFMWRLPPREDETLDSDLESDVSNDQGQIPLQPFVSLGSVLGVIVCAAASLI